MKLRNLTTSILIAVALPLASSAATVIVDSYSGALFDSDQGASPAFIRPVPNGNSAPVALSGGIANYFYHAYDFTVGTTGSYFWQSTQDNFDGQLVLYAGGFNDASPLTNAVIADDDADPTCSGGLTDIRHSCLPGGPAGGFISLNTGVNYTLVTTSFSSSTTGTFTNTLWFDNMEQIPEPSTMLLMGAGLALVGLVRRKRQIS